MNTFERYQWTHHAHEKMRFYRLTESRIKRIIRYPTRVEEGILEGAVAAMQPASAEATAGTPATRTLKGTPLRRKKYSEIWVMYVVTKSKIKNQEAKVRIITAWRYPGKSPERDPIPASVLREVASILRL